MATLASSASAAAPPRPRLDRLQALRFLAALLVVIGHCQHELVAALGTAAGAMAKVPFDWGVGVDIFFVISGFIMWHLMHDRFAKSGEPSRFLHRRIFRIVPIYWLCTTLIAVGTLRQFDTATSVPFGLASYFFLPWPHPDGRGLFPVLSLGWTLNYEMMFYCVFTAALTLRKVWGASLMLAVFVALAIAAGLAPKTAFMLQFWGNPIIFEFLLGAGVAALYHRGLRIGQWLSLAMFAAGFAIAVACFQSGAYNHASRLFTGGIPAVLIVTAVVCRESSALRSRSGKALVLGGDASYALYLVHPFALKAIAAVSARLGLWAIAPLAPPAAMIVAAVIASLLTYRFIEKPILTALLKRAEPPIAKVA